MTWNHSGGVSAARVAPDGTVRDTTEILVVPPRDGGGTAYGGRPSGHPGGWLVGWTDSKAANSDVYVARVDANGAVLDPAGIPLATTVRAELLADISFDGTNHLVTWTSDAVGRELYGARVSPAGALVGAPFLITTRELPVDGRGGLVAQSAFDGSNHLVILSGGPYGTADVEVVRVSPAGVVLDATPIPVAKDGSYAGIVGTAAGALAVHHHPGHDGLGVVAHRLSPAGKSLDPAGGILVSRTANRQRTPVVATSGGVFLVVWSDSRDGDANGLRAYAQRFAPSGAPLDPVAFPVTPPIASIFGPELKLAYDGTNFVLGYIVDGKGSGPDTINAVRISVMGKVLEPAPVLIASPKYGSSLRVASAGAGTLFVWLDDFKTYSGRLSLEGNALDVAAPRLLHSGSGSWLSLAALDGAYALAWRDTNGADTIRGLRLAADGTPIDTTPSYLGRGAGFLSDPILVPRPRSHDHLVLWTGSEDGVHASTFPVTGTQPSDAGVGTMIAAAPAECLGATGDSIDRVTIVVQQSDAGAPLEVIPIAPDGRPLPAQRVTLSERARLPFTTEERVAMAASSTGCVMAAYERFDPAPPFAALRVRSRSIEYDAGACGAASFPTPDDAGAQDSGPPPSSGPPAASTPDASSATMPAPADDGCGCEAVGASATSPWALVGVLASIAAVVRRRSRR